MKLMTERKRQWKGKHDAPVSQGNESGPVCEMDGMGTD